MRTLLALLVVLVMVGCGQQAMTELPDGVVCSEDALDTIRENPPDERADPDSPEFNQFYMLSYYRSAGCETPEPTIEPLGS